MAIVIQFLKSIFYSKLIYSAIVYICCFHKNENKKWFEISKEIVRGDTNHGNGVLMFCAFIPICKSQSCKEIPQSFTSYSEAMQIVQNADFEYTDKLPYGKSSWIVTADYYSCYGYTGYLIYTTDKGHDYIHIGVPKNIWLAFKNATSSGSYYDYNIKGKYRLYLH